MRTRGMLILIVSLLSTTVLSATSWAADAAPMDATEHQSMAQGYQDEAKEASARVASHTLMLNRYQSSPIVPKGSPVSKTEMVSHCQKLVDGYKQVESEASSLAKLHQQAAGAASGH